MSLAIIVDPEGVEVKPIGEEGEDGERIIVARIIVFKNQTDPDVSVGPFDQQQWEAFLAFLNDPETETKKQEARSKIMLANGGTMPPAMAVPKG